MRMPRWIARATPKWAAAATATALFAAASLTATPARADGGWSGEPVASSAADTQGCAQVLLVGVRGSGQEAPYGDMVDGVRSELSARLDGQRPDLRLAQAYLDYPATSLDEIDTASVQDMVLGEESSPAPAYVSSVEAGTAELIRLAEAEAQRCPAEKLLVVGYSQGAEVATRALGSGALNGNLLGAVLLGNPLHYDGQNITELDGTASNRSYGLTAALYYLKAELAGSTGDRQAQVQRLVEVVVALYDGTVDTASFASAMTGSGAAVPGEAAPRTWSVCTAGDPVCDSADALSNVLTSSATLQNARSEGGAQHGSYTPENLPGTLDAVTAELTGLPRASEAEEQQPATEGPGRGGAVLGALCAGALLAGGAAAVIVRRRRAGRAGAENRPTGRRAGRDRAQP
ncbi:cutinase family protein [Propionibacterium australiense]|nr:cutinase family protein [Propionibacterium australiense]SYZ33150.1 Alpha/Beta hydrolase fold [Propionibacterium australiense]VEH89166.1 Cutinase [Propionibacterium australiense]